MEISEESDRKLNLEKPSKRASYLELIDQLLVTAFTKAQGQYCKNRERIAWMRVISQLVKAGSMVLRDVDIEDLLKRIEGLEKAVNAR
jgi:hypothetical protein